MNDSVRYERCQQIQLGVLTESQEAVDILANGGSELELPQGTGNVSQRRRHSRIKSLCSLY